MPSIFDIITTLEDRISTIERFGGSLGASSTPTSSSPGVPGQIKWDSSNIYICVATDTWKKVSLSTF